VSRVDALIREGSATVLKRSGSARKDRIVADVNAQSVFSLVIHAFEITPTTISNEVQEHERRS
jgi:hypothetical protein